MRNIQQTVSDFVSEYGLETSVEIRYIDLVSEVGELGKEILKSGDYGSKVPVKTGDLAGEIGDVVFSLACIANALGVDMEKALMEAIEKYKSRFNQTGNIGSNGI
jgi:NTP pyrophosphatase (non-canonical NTP hydrolase)